MQTIGEQVTGVLRELMAQAGLGEGSLVVIGCSTSEIAGKAIGKAGSMEIGEAVVRGALLACGERGAALAVQCCEHLNRALVMQRNVAVARQYQQVQAVPYQNAGGACASAAFRMLEDPVVVEQVQGEAGIDIGDTLIGMHLKRVAVPFRSKCKQIGNAHLTMAYTRPPYIGGPRTRYTLEEA